MEALLTYLTAALLKDPIFPYDGVEDSDTIGAALMELVVRNQCIKNKVALNLHTSFRDALAYGVGIAGTSWERRWGKKAIRSSGVTDGFDGQQGFDNVSMQTDLLFEGNALFNIDPYMWLPDPSVSSIGIQKGEFQGWIDRTSNYLNLLSMESEKNSTYFNVKYLKYKQNKRSILALDQSDRKKRDGGPSDLHRSMTYITHPIDVIKLYVNVIPSEWKLGTSEYPEKWYFELASDDVIIRAEKADYAHGNYPVAVASPEFDGYNILPIGKSPSLNICRSISGCTCREVVDDYRGTSSLYSAHKGSGGCGIQCISIHRYCYISATPSSSGVRQSNYRQCPNRGAY